MAWLAMALVLLLAASCAVPTQPASPSASPLARSGGTLRVVVPAVEQPFGRWLAPDGDPGALDPHLDAYSSYDAWELLRCCLARTLLSNNGRSTEEGGARLHPDLARELPEISGDGLTWTFRLKQGLHYGPPMADVEIVAADVIRALHRLMAPALRDGAYARNMYPHIVGAQAYLDGEATSIAGLESPDPYTLVIRLTRPAGDLGARLAITLPIPIPPSPSNPRAPFGVADGHDDGYGRFLVSSGPYMLEGSADLDFSLSPAEQTPVAGLVPGQRISLVRNPAWDPSSDPLRPAMPDRIEFQVVPTVDAGAAEIYARRADLLLDYLGTPQIPTRIADVVRADPALGKIHVNEADFTGGIMMNLATAPFDDLHVRRAVSHATNRRRIVELLGGPLILRVAHHLVPDAMEDNLLVDYRPYPSANDEGDLAAAMAEMRQSAYDTDGDGVCDAPACVRVPALARDVPPFPDVAQSVKEDLARVGVDLDLQAVSIEDFFAAYEDPARRVAMYVPLGWAKDALSPAGFFTGQFYGPAALDSTGNGSLVGATPDQLEQWGYGDIEVPNVDERIEACLPLTGTGQFECWAALDQHMMENVVPTVMYGSGVGVVLSSTRVVGYSWDQLAGAPALDRIVLAP